MLQRPPIFIGGTGRSGTTLLVRILERHPAIFTLRWESQFLVAPGGLLGIAERGFLRGDLHRFQQRMRGRWWSRVLNPGKPNEYTAGLATDLATDDLERALEFLDESSRGAGAADAPAIVRGFCDRLFGPAATRAGAARWCEKTPRNILFADRLAEAFPEMKMVHVIRDGRDVAASIVSRGFWPIAAGHEFPGLDPFRGETTYAGAAAYWAEVLSIAREVTADLPPDRYHELRFEDLIEDPEARLRDLCAFLGEDFVPELLDPDLSRHNIGRWRAEMSADDVAAFERIAAATLRTQGYGPER